jgi:hypothetical protein
MSDILHNTTPPDASGFSDEINLLASSAPEEIPSSKAEQLFLVFHTVNNAAKKKQIHPLRKRRRAEEWISPCSF